MIVFIEGKIDELKPNKAVFAIGGLGRLVHIPLSTYAAMEDMSHARLHTHHIIREDADLLYGIFVRGLDLSRSAAFFRHFSCCSACLRRIASLIDSPCFSICTQFGQAFTLLLFAGTYWWRHIPHITILVCEPNSIYFTVNLTIPDGRSEAFSSSRFSIYGIGVQTSPEAVFSILTTNVSFSAFSHRSAVV